MASARRVSVWVPFTCVVAAIGCAEIVGLTGEYSEATGGRSPDGSGGTGGDGAETGGVSQGGSGVGGTRGGSPPTGGDAGESGNAGTGTGGEEATGGTSGTPNGGTSGAGTGGGGTGGGVVNPPSCEGGLSTCGPDGTTNCCANHGISPTVPFNRGNDPLYPATLSAFRLDDYEVTVARFRKFVAAFGDDWRPSVGDGRNLNNEADEGWAPEWNDQLPESEAALRFGLACHPDYPVWTDEEGDNEFRAMNCVNWYVAGAFCIWDGGRLPTEAEWNFAAAGGEQQRLYPWSNPPGQDVIAERYASYFVDEVRECGGDNEDGCAVTDFIRPGSRPRGNGFFGHADLAGNVYEWVQDRYAPYSNPCDDCANLTNGSDRTIRGGCFSNYFVLMRTAFRLNWDPATTDAGIGIRCARQP